MTGIKTPEAGVRKFEIVVVLEASNCPTVHCTTTGAKLPLSLQSSRGGGVLPEQCEDLC